jgi:hypothetical protein
MATTSSGNTPPYQSKFLAGSRTKREHIGIHVGLGTSGAGAPVDGRGLTTTERGMPALDSWTMIWADMCKEMIADVTVALEYFRHMHTGKHLDM